MNEMQLFDVSGKRLYLTPEERNRFAHFASTHAKTNEARTFCRTIYYTGCRPSEALALTNNQIDFADQGIVIRSLKKRANKESGEPNIKHRFIPIPVSFLDELNLVHNLQGQKKECRLWPWSRATGWKRVAEVMEAASISGIHANAKGLRHAFGVNAVIKNVPLPTLQKWLGHEDLNTTAIYAQAVGDEERQLASRLW